MDHCAFRTVACDCSRNRPRRRAPPSRPGRPTSPRAPRRRAPTPRRGRRPTSLLRWRDHGTRRTPSASPEIRAKTLDTASPDVHEAFARPPRAYRSPPNTERRCARRTLRNAPTGRRTAPQTLSATAIHPEAAKSRTQLSWNRFFSRTRRSPSRDRLRASRRSRRFAPPRFARARAVL